MRTASTDDRHQRRAEFDEQVMVEGLPWVPARPTLGSRFFSGLCQVPVNKMVSGGFPGVFRFPQLLLRPSVVYPGFPSQQQLSVGSVSNRGRRWVLDDGWHAVLSLPVCIQEQIFS